jgi:hypothetical protein
VTTTEISNTVVAVARSGSMATPMANGRDNRPGRAAGSKPSARRG